MVVLLSVMEMVAVLVLVVVLLGSGVISMGSVVSLVLAPVNGVVPLSIFKTVVHICQNTPPISIGENNVVYYRDSSNQTTYYYATQFNNG